jgi:hypothetical protein
LDHPISRFVIIAIAVVFIRTFVIKWWWVSTKNK